jgi:hypothetical protein
VDQACDRINENTTHHEQDHPYQIIDLLLEFGEPAMPFATAPQRWLAAMVGMAAAMMMMSLYIVHTRLFGRQPGMSREKLPSCRLSASFR